ncbi:hypothetical protein V757_09605 [Pelistega indica]|uniref:DUF484 domain-containing protein n=1 Tax=Pelistega indica TaxID=1414851 RepID=V8FYI0_9BURK|nr:DUF484 family protein [Pelistega indica]ETD68926.1 hypothetical protein V757_09605 [Pelistega indica]
MTNEHLSPEVIAEFLRNNPNFLTEHADIFSEIRVPNPDGPGSLSLLEKQVSTLRDRLHSTQNNLYELGDIAVENQGINDTITDWCATLLAQKEEELIPAAIVTGLQDAFPELEVELLLWGFDQLEDYQLEENVEVQQYIKSLVAPYTGSDIHPGIAAWLSNPAGSIGIAPLYVNDIAIGALVFASQDAKHFYPDMGVFFLENLGYLASAAISRLAPSIMDEEVSITTQEDEQEQNSHNAEDDDYPELDPA